MDATVACAKYTGSVEFVGAAGPDPGKRLDCSATGTALRWVPQHASYQQFMARGAVDVYSLEEPLQGLGIPHKA